MNYLSLFSGYGGFELGIQQAYEKLCIANEKEKNERVGDSKGFYSERNNLCANGFTCIGFSEIDKYATQVYKKHFNHKEYGDITKINAKELPDFDLICGGFPCQAFSIAGKRRGFEDTRGTLIYDVLRIIKEKHPKYVLLENVKGLLSHDSGRTFKTIITSLAELGYAVEWQVLNAKNFGVPQNRERVFIIGHLGGFGGRQVFPLGESNREHHEQDTQGNDIAYCLQAGGDKHRGSYVKVGTLRTHKDGNGFRELKTGISPTIPARARQDGSGQPCILSRPHGFNNGGEKEMPCFRSCNNFSGNELLKEGYKIRRLTPTECERLMGLPDGWTEYRLSDELKVDERGLAYVDILKVSDTQRYKLCGNGVVVNVVEEIIKRLFL